MRIVLIRCNIHTYFPLLTETRYSLFPTSLQKGSESTTLLLDCFTLQRNIRSLTFAVVIHGVSIAKSDSGSNTRDEREEFVSDLAPVEHVVKAQCAKLARQCSTLLASASASLSLFDNNDSISILQEKSKALALATQRWKDLSNSKQSKTYSLCSLFEPRMKVIMAADALYYRLYYYEQMVAFTPPQHISHHPQLVGVTNKNKK
jgi:type II secretory pathway component PulF